MNDIPSRTGAALQTQFRFWHYSLSAWGTDRGTLILLNSRAFIKCPWAKEVGPRSLFRNVVWIADVNWKPTAVVSLSSGFSCMTNKILLMDSAELVMLLSHLATLRHPEWFPLLVKYAALCLRFLNSEACSGLIAQSHRGHDDHFDHSDHMRHCERGCLLFRIFYFAQSKVTVS